MAFDKILFGLILVLGALLLVIWLIPEPPGATGVKHPTFAASNMKHGGADAPPDMVLPLGWALGAVLISLMAGCIGFGAGQRARRRGFLKPLCFGWLLHLTTFTLMVVVYHQTAGEPDVPLFLSLTPSTAVMLYALWPASFIYVFIWAIGFRRYVFSEQDHATYQSMLAAKQSSRQMEARHALREEPQ